MLSGISRCRGSLQIISRATDAAQVLMSYCKMSMLSSENCAYCHRAAPLLPDGEYDHICIRRRCWGARTPHPKLALRGMPLRAAWGRGLLVEGHILSFRRYWSGGWDRMQILYWPSSVVSNWERHKGRIVQLLAFASESEWPSGGKERPADRSVLCWLAELRCDCLGPLNIYI